jgi:hypothetical protein
LTTFRLLGSMRPTDNHLYKIEFVTSLAQGQNQDSNVILPSPCREVSLPLCSQRLPQRKVIE